MIYISEVHAIDSELWTIALAKEKNIYQHVDLNDRVNVANMMCNETGIDIPILVDEMNNPVANRYGAFPTRFCLIDLDGRIVATNHKGPMDLDRVIAQTEKWLTDFRKTAQP